MDSVQVHLNLLDFWSNIQAHGICIANSGVLTQYFDQKVGEAPLQYCKPEHKAEVFQVT